jgi:choline monooxygenase
MVCAERGTGPRPEAVEPPLAPDSLEYPAMMSPIPDDLFSPRHYAGARAPLEQASGLPNWAYTSQAFYGREVERIFLRYWIFAGRADELPSVGDYRVVDTVGGQVILLRGNDGSIRALANACRHRGTQLLAGEGSCRSIVCPYHSWVYDLDGRLKRAPGMDGIEGFDPDAHRLIELRMEDWAGYLFFTFNPEAPALLEHLGDMPERFAGHRLEEMVCTRRVRFDIACNWKLVMENAVEAYHTGTVHRDSLGRQTETPLDTRGAWHGLLVHGEQSVAVLPASRSESRTFPQIPTIGEEARRGTYFTVIFPCTQFAVAQDCMWWLDIHPSGPETSRLIVGSCFPRSTVERADFEDIARDYYRRWDTATPEDNRISEMQQIGQRVPGRPPGRLARSEFAVHRLANWVLDQVLDEEPAGVATGTGSRLRATG